MIDAIETLEGEMNAGSVTIGSSDYNELKNKPSINGVELVGAKTLEELNIQPKGDYAEKADIPTVPTKLSELENDEGYLKEFTESDPTVPTHVKNISEDDISKWNNKSEFSGDYNDLSNKPVIPDIPTVPTKVSELENDSNFISSIPEDYAKKEYIDEKLGDIETILSTLATVTECEHINTTFVEHQDSEDPSICHYSVFTCNDCGETVTVPVDHDTYERTLAGKTYILCHNCNMQELKPATHTHTYGTPTKVASTDNPDICYYNVSTCDCGDEQREAIAHDTYEETLFGQTFIYCHNCDMEEEKVVAHIHTYGTPRKIAKADGDPENICYYNVSTCTCGEEQREAVEHSYYEETDFGETWVYCHNCDYEKFKSSVG